MELMLWTCRLMSINNTVLSRIGKSITREISFDMTIISTPLCDVGSSGGCWKKNTMGEARLSVAARLLRWPHSCIKAFSLECWTYHLLLTNRIQQIWGEITPMIRLQKTVTFILPTDYLSCRLSRRQLPWQRSQAHGARNGRWPPGSTQNIMCSVQPPERNWILPTTPERAWKWILPQLITCDETPVLADTLVEGLWEGPNHR